MAKQTFEPGPGRSTSDQAFNDIKKEIAARNERMQKEARKLRTAREQVQARERRKRDLL